MQLFEIEDGVLDPRRAVGRDDVFCERAELGEHFARGKRA